MSRTGPLLASLLVTALLAGGACCPPPPQPPCQVDRYGGFALAGVSDALRAARDGWQEDPPLVPQDVGNRCCSLWNDLVTAHCADQLGAFCRDECPPDETSRCVDKDRELVREACYRAVLPQYHELVPECARMAVQGLQPTWPSAAGEPAACPSAE